MKLLDLTLPTPAANLACDEALLDWCEAGHCEGLLRFWESPEYFVVLGYANRAVTEVNLAACQKSGIPVLRRCSGGGTVLQGPGCLNYSLVLRIEGGLESITQTNCYVMDRNRAALLPIINGRIEIRGHTDLALDDLKFSGNAQRRRRQFLLFHGTFLLNFDLKLIGQLLKFPSRQPDYRVDRSHAQFLTPLPLDPHSIKVVLQKQWQADEPMTVIPIDAIDHLVRDRYSKDDWNMKW